MEDSRQSEVRHYGKKQSHIPAGLKEHHHYLKPSATKTGPPEFFDNYSKINDWFLDGNDIYGDCTMAAAAHAIRAWNAATGSSDPVPHKAALLEEYFKLTGGPDTGLVESLVLKTWHDSGLCGNKILGYAPIDIHNLDHIRHAAHLYGIVYIGVQMTKGAEHQFKLKKPWTVKKGQQANTVVGGHAIPIVGYDKNSFYVVTWGRIQEMTYDWWHAHGDEAWAVLPHQLKEAGTYHHLDLEQLTADLKNI